MLKITIFMIATVIGVVYAAPAPAPQQDMQTAVLLAAGQMKDLANNGAAAKDSKSMDFFGMKMEHESGVGFGDAMTKGRRRRETTVNMVNVINVAKDNNPTGGSQSTSSPGSDDL